LTSPSSTQASILITELNVVGGAIPGVVLLRLRPGSCDDDNDTALVGGIAAAATTAPA
jgi:hypothetical protein